MHLTIDADLEFSVEVPGDQVVTGRLTGSGTDLELEVSDPFVFAGRGDTRAVSGLAGALAARGITVAVVGPRGRLLTLGVRRTSWWQRRLTRSRHVRVEAGAGLLSLALGRARAGRAGALPSADLVPPATMWPIAPTLRRRPRRVTTTHDVSRGGNPRLIMAPGAHPQPGDHQEVFGLNRDVTTIGSDERCDIRLAGLDPVHAEVRHDRRDEFVLVRVGRPADTRVNGRPVDTALLRTASRIDLGGWTLSFFREEHADHGRPYGGRQGGEIGHQRPQPPRPDDS